MIDDTDRPNRPRRSPVAARPRGDVVRELREGLADRVPVTLRAGSLDGSWAVPWRAAVVALVLAVVVGTALLARAQGPTQEVVPVGPARAANGRGTSSRAGAAAGDGAAGGVANGGTAAPGVSAPGVSGLGGPSGASGVVVHVIGRVRRPGLVRLPAGGRVSDAVTAAGGPAPGARLDRLNLARLLSDGEQIAIPGPNDPLPPVAGSAGGAGGAGAGSGVGGTGGAAGPGVANPPVDLNTATPADLDALPGVGPVLAGRILAWRTQHGRFTRVAELGEVPGIGDKLLAQLTPLVRV